ncbi:MAG: HNH endonuclease, partial [Lentisphaeria bacterium]|nr:HNH endonuclease [Lentisphaeria bacterium]
DKYYFDERIIKQNFNAQPDSTRKSSNLLKDANDFFSKEFEKIQDITVLTTWYKVVANAIITTFVMEGPDAKLLATQIFAFQNDRGKDLTKLEKLKAYCMHKIYCCVTSEEITTQIQYMEKCFSEIYSKVEELSTFEDHILNWHCQAFTSWTKNEAFECIKYDFNNSDNKKQWLINFINSLSKTYKLMSQIEEAKKGNRDRIVADICYLDEANSVPLLLKLLHYGDRNFDEYNDILNVIEKILFKMRFTTGNYRTNNLINYAREYSGNNEELIKKLKDVVNSGFQWWWNFNDSCKKYFEENTYHYRSDIKYILYKYENYLRKEAKLPELDTNEYSNIFRSKKLENTLDHITPQNPNFTTYNEEFKSESLNNIGNLTLCTWSNNASKNNSNPAEIKEFYDNIYLSHKEIYDTLKNTGKWGKEEISARKDKLLQFIKRQWDI